ncbi:xanthine dehydrogenase family protein subunit M [Ancylobacter sp. MQZ15Z-1]|uniref:Xanthine dehydrogenase family protein subunit M n=1 Tax=Ancylobacter mangrovi TaxID=2972472 RepID=A0A9X2PJ80_9HYPH|nr:xanthine dehydrogenase family protein subunit M [Ancylobacter mangrovi]MCS0497253.1 xanthine dehydrogenase family protein subunit M [Ancylobacter mangrovi]
MKPPPFAYFRPGTLDEAIAILGRTENAKVLAGGQSLMAMLNLRYVFPDALVDINDLFELSGIEIAPERIRIGAMTRQRRIELDAELYEAMPIFRDALKLVGHRQTRNRGTIGGSLCHLDPASELPTLALLLDAGIETAGPAGVRRIPVGEFITGYMMPGIGPDEIVTAIEFAPWSVAHGHAFHEFARRHGDFAVASAAVMVERDRQGVVTRCAIAIGGIGSVPQRHGAGETALTGSDGGPDAIAAALESCAGLDILGDFHGGPDYRLSVARTMLRRSLTAALARASERTQQA